MVECASASIVVRSFVAVNLRFLSRKKIRRVVVFLNSSFSHFRFFRITYLQKERSKRILISLYGNCNGCSIRRERSVYTVLYRRFKKTNYLLSQGGQIALTAEEENLIVKRISVPAKWGCPFNRKTSRLSIKGYLEWREKIIRKF